MLEEFENLKKENQELKEKIKHLQELEKNKKKGMIKKASEGFGMSRPPFGYVFKSGKLVPAQNYREVEEIFQEFLKTNLSLRQLSKKRGFSVNGLKKVLTNFTYIGKIKFNGQIFNGNHQPIVSSSLFNYVQDKLEKLKIKKIK
jgi:site-specific DNA recombinase